MQRRSIVASLSAFLAGLVLSVGMNTAFATGPSDNPPDGNVSPNFYSVTTNEDVGVGNKLTVGDTTAGHYVIADDYGYVYALSDGTYPYAVSGWTNNATAGESGVNGAVAEDGLWTIGYLAYMDSDGDTWGLYTPGNITGANLYTNGDNGYLYTNKISAPSGTLTLTASDKLDVNGDLTADTVGSFRYECAGTWESGTSVTSVTASCDGANDVMVACSGYSINDYEGALPTSATDCTAYSTSESITLQAYAYCFDPSSTTNTTSTTCSDDYNRFRDNEVGITVDIDDTAPGAPTGLGATPSGTVGVTVDIDDTAPGAPTGLGATPSGTTVVLDWDDNDSSEGVSYYNVYRSTTSGFSVSSSTPITTRTTSSYSDTGRVTGTTYYYKVTAVDGSDNESSASGQAGATIADTTAPATPTGLSAASDGYFQIALDWTNNSESDLAGYYVYRSTSSSFTASSSNKIGATSSSSYTDTPPSGGIYYYKVAAYDTAGNTSYASSAKGAESVSSFVAGTKVLTMAGIKNIEDLKIGDKVFSWDLTTGKLTVSNVTQVRSHYDTELYTINGTLKVTGLHPFAVKNGNAIVWKKVKDLVIGDLLVSSDNSTIAINSIVRSDLKTPVMVYNPSMDGTHNYFVLIDGQSSAILVHNKTSEIPLY